MNTSRPLALSVIAFAMALTLSIAGPASAAERSSTAATGTLTQSTDTLDFGRPVIGSPSPAQTVTFTAVGSTAVKFGTAGLTGYNAPEFTISADTCSGASIPGGSSCHISVIITPTVLNYHEAAVTLPSNATASPATVALRGTAVVSAAGTYHWLTAARILDTRYGTGAPKKPVGPGGVVHLQVTGHGGVPVADVSAVVLNVTETSATRSGFLTVYPTGTTRPIASNLNYTSRQTLANLVTVAVSASGQVDLYNTGSAQLIADISGYYSATDASPTGGEFHAVSPERILDTRTDRLQHAIGPGESLDVTTVLDTINLGALASAGDVNAFAVNITAVDATGSGYLTAWRFGDVMPATSTLNFVKGTNTPNMAIAPVSDCGGFCGPPGTINPTFTVQNNSPTATVQVLVDLVGFFDDGSLRDGMRFHPITPQRIADSRYGQGLPSPLAAGETDTIVVPSSIADSRTGAVALNVTAVAPTASTYLTLWPAGSSRPIGSTLNPAAHQTVANAAIVIFSTAQPAEFNVYNATGTTGFVADVAGYYDFDPPA